MITALVPLKANSERIKGKNFKKFVDKPLFKWIIDVLLTIDQVDKIVINTDARDLLIEHGLDINNPKILLRERRKDLCGDYVSMNKILEDDLENVPSDYYLMTHVTNPLLSGETIIKGIEKFLKAVESDGIDSLFSVTKFQTRFYDGEAKPINHNPEELLRTQDLPPYYEENSCLYLFSKASFNATKSRIGKQPILLEIPKFEAIDIDTSDEWVIGESIANFYFSK